MDISLSEEKIKCKYQLTSVITKNDKRKRIENRKDDKGMGHMYV